MMRITGVIGAALFVAACSSGSDVAKDRDGPKEVADISKSIYQPTVHAILALSGGFDADGDAQSIETVWHRAGTQQKVRLQLSPDQVTVQALGAGRYVLDSLVVDGRQLLVATDDESRTSPVSDVVLDPGEVIYGGDLIIREREAQRASADAPRKLVLRISSSAKRARAAVAAKYSRQAGNMQTRLLRKR